MIKMIFEDKDTTPSSILLKSSMAGSLIHFTNGNSRLYYDAIKFQKQGYIVFMFLDLSPKGINTIKHYDNVMSKIKNNNVKNVYVLPIVCIEQFILSFLIKYNYISPDREAKALYLRNWNEITVNESLEHIFKKAIARQTECMKNKFKYCTNDGPRDTQSIRGIFYEKSCKCQDCDINCKDELSLKAERLYTELPVFVVETQQHKDLLKQFSIEIKHKHIKDFLEDTQKFYDEISTSLGLDKMIIEGWEFYENIT